MTIISSEHGQNEHLSESGKVVEVNIVYEGKLCCKSTHGPSGSELLTDAPKDNMGEGKYFSPTDLVGTSLGTCMLTIMGIVAQRENIDMSGSTVRVVKEMITGAERRIGKLTVEFSMKGVLTEEQQQKLRNAAMTCPVKRSLHPDVELDIKFEWT